eukprot:CAMPEP_0172371424 /NCGR_PEP_ID=MMETSP1060-20121228/42838_1 /TAXON_ID=37318 /ORGANISM="Pseudo-nitzschia pungens, Strain cf. cingulata" /LENGTH=89 /DNA_ID=CAMNT_0013097047 /DNA_START=83 /DNA_END=352 /DNA_ORIENTATION=+
MTLSARAAVLTRAAAKRCLATSAAGKLIQRRATTGSVSSVFYLKTLGGGNASAKQQAAFVENVFTGLVGLPIGILGLGGLYRMACEGKL